ELIADGAVTANANAQETRAASFALRLPNGIEDAAADPFQIAVEAFAAIGRRQRILGAHVLATAAFEDEANIDRIFAMLMPVEHRPDGAQIVPAVAAGDAIDGILPQITEPRRFHDGIAADFLQLQLIEPDRRANVEGNRPRILANRGAEAFGQADILQHE